MKHEWRKHEKEWYLPKKKPQLLEMPTLNFITITGQGNPNGPDYAERIAALYPIAYRLKFKAKKGLLAREPFDYTVYPLEGLWTQTDYQADKPLNKDLFVYKMMIRQPEGITQEDFFAVQAELLQQKNLSLLSEVQFETYTEGQVVQIMHLGPYDDEAASFEIIDSFLEEFGLERQLIMDEYAHREIYLSDPRRVTPDKYKTNLRVKVQERTSIEKK